MIRNVRIGDPIFTIGELRVLIGEFDDNDKICIETIDKHGDAQDLYPMYLDCIEGIELDDGTVINEIRFCQLPNTVKYI